jgi:predicted MFS family arabinose efflux permease
VSLTNIFTLYINSFKGISKEIWFLSLVTLINRAGTMVIPFLTIYLKTDKNFSLDSIAWVMSSFGLGSVAGAWIGGKLVAKIGFYSLMFWSLFLSGIAFIVLQFFETFLGICIGIFFVMLLADAFRPASYVAVNSYSTDENKTRSLSLLRLAINLGFSFGPAIGGIIILKIGFSGLFWIDGVTCILAGLCFLLLLNNKASKLQKDEGKTLKANSPYKDFNYLILVFLVFLIGFTFLQYFSTVPLFYKEVFKFNEQEIGLLFFLNGFLIFLIEMPLVKYLEKPNISIYKTIFISLFLLSFSFLILALFSWSGIAIIGILLMTFGEMFNFPFINTLALNRAKKGNMGEYMALFTIAFSLAHILGHNIGLNLIYFFGYYFTWIFMSIILILCVFLLILYKKRVENEIHLEK